MALPFSKNSPRAGSFLSLPLKPFVACSSSTYRSADVVQPRLRSAALDARAAAEAAERRPSGWPVDASEEGRALPAGAAEGPAQARRLGGGSHHLHLRTERCLPSRAGERLEARAIPAQEAGREEAGREEMTITKKEVGDQLLTDVRTQLRHRRSHSTGCRTKGVADSNTGRAGGCSSLRWKPHRSSLHSDNLYQSVTPAATAAPLVWLRHTLRRLYLYHAATCGSRVASPAAPVAALELHGCGAACGGIDRR